MKWIGLLLLVLITDAAQAHGVKLAMPEHPQWKEECGSCHIAYPPQLLTADNWQGLMGGLDKHFGENATLDAKDRRTILDFLQRHAGSGASHAASSLRISDTPWFRREHHEVSSKAWSDPAVKSPANCGACHVKADQGDWSERGVHMPAGLEREEDEDEDD